jgi:hypothetical protein
MPRILNFYMDDSGTRRPNRKPLAFRPEAPDFFALGGVLVNEEDEGPIRAAYDELCSKWSITYPLHSAEIRHSSDNFAWLKRDGDEYRRFMRDLTGLLTRISVIGIACVIDRPGYDSRYRAQYGRQQWQLCKTAFCIAVERAAKYAVADRRKLRVMPERSSKDDDERLRKYFQDMRTAGLPFDSASSASYHPLAAEALSSTLYELRFKRKSSPLVQVADLYLWPMARGGYDPTYKPYVMLVEAGRLIEQNTPETEHATRATKYSCFELVGGRRPAS